MNYQLSPGTLCLLSLALVVTVFVADVCGQERPDDTESQMSLRKSAETREYQGQAFQGENRQIVPGDSLWRILVQEKNLPEKKFGQYVALIQRLNPQLKNTSILKVGDTLFIPMRPDEILVTPSSVSKNVVAPSEFFGQGFVKEYRVKRGNHLYQILRDQLGIKDQRQLAVYFALVKDLNPQRKEWDTLQEGEMIRLPTADSNKVLTAENAPLPAAGTRNSVQSGQSIIPLTEILPTPRTPVALDHARRLLVRDNLPLLEQVLNAFGGEVKTDGQEVFALKDGTVKIDRRSYPIISNRKLQQKVILDTGERIPASLRKRLESPDAGATVLSLAAAANLQEAVSQLLPRLGYQALPNDRSIVVQEGDVSVESRGTWMALAPEESGKAQEVFIVTITDQAGEIPEYLGEQMSAKGLHLKDVVLASSSGRSPMTSERPRRSAEIKIWPREKSDKIDALLLAYGISFSVAEMQAIELGEGLRFESRSDRVFDSRGQQIGLFFQPVEPEIKKVLQQRQRMKVVELDLSTLSAKEIINRMLGELGDQTVYRQHRFSADTGNNDRVNISTSGFWLRNRSMFLTDRQIPTFLHQFFFEKGLELVYFE
jgi:hypothetical protein